MTSHVQGLFKYGLYEVFKDVYSNIAGEETAKAYKGLVGASRGAG